MALKTIPVGSANFTLFTYDPVNRTISAKWAYVVPKTEIVNPVDYCEVRFEFADTKGQWYTYYVYNQRVTGESYGDLNKVPPVTFTTPKSVPLPYNAIQIRARIKIYPRYFQDSKQAYGTDPTALYPAFNNGNKFVETSPELEQAANTILQSTILDMPSDPEAPQVDIDDKNNITMSYQTTDTKAFAVEFEIINNNTLEALKIQKVPLGKRVSNFYDRTKPYALSEIATLDARTFQTVTEIPESNLDLHYDWADIPEYNKFALYNLGNMMYRYDNEYNNTIRYAKDSIIVCLVDIIDENSKRQEYRAFKCKVDNTAPDYDTSIGKNYTTGEYIYANKGFWVCKESYKNTSTENTFAKNKAKWTSVKTIPFDENQWERCQTYIGGVLVDDLSLLSPIVYTCTKIINASQASKGLFTPANWTAISNIKDFNPNYEYLSVNPNGVGNISIVRTLPEESYPKPRFCLNTSISMALSTKKVDVPSSQIETISNPVEGTYYLTSDNEVWKFYKNDDGRGNKNITTYKYKSYFPIKGSAKGYYYAEDVKAYYIFGKTRINNADNLEIRPKRKIEQYSQAYIKDGVLYSDNKYTKVITDRTKYYFVEDDSNINWYFINDEKKVTQISNVFYENNNYFKYNNGSLTQVKGIKVKQIAGYVEVDYPTNDRWIKQENTTIIWTEIDNVPQSDIRKGFFEYHLEGTASNVKVHCRLYGEYGSITGFGDFSTDVKTIPGGSEAEVDEEGNQTGSVSLDDFTVVPYGYEDDNVQLRIDWKPTEGAESYDIQYTTKKEYFDSENLCTTTTVEHHSLMKGEDTLTYITAPIKGGEYYVRIRATNSSGAGAWTMKNTPVVTGLVPSAPSTWSSRTTVATDEEVYLYWVHNSRDESVQTKAEIIIEVDGKAPIPIKVSNFVGGSQSSYAKGEACIRNGTVYIAKQDMHGTEEVPLIFDENLWERTGGIKIKASDYTSDSSNELKWRVRTMGPLGSKGPTNDGYSEYSVTRSIKCYANPEITSLKVVSEVNDVEGTTTIDAYPFKIEMIATPDLQTPISATLEIVSTETYAYLGNIGEYKTINIGDVIYTENFDISMFSNEQKWKLTKIFNPSDAILKPDITYKVRAKIDMNSGLSASYGYDDSRPDILFKFFNNNQKVGFVTNVTFDPKTLTSTIIPRAYATNEEGEEIDDTLLANELRLSVYRIDYNGELILIGQNLPADGTSAVTDPYPSLAYLSYRIIGIHQTTGEVYVYDTPIEYVGYLYGGNKLSIFNDKGLIEEYRPTPIVIQWNNGISRDGVPIEDMVKLPYNIDISESNDKDVSTVKYIGRKRPVSYYGTQLGEKASWSTVVFPDDMEMLNKLRRLAIYMGDVYVREPSGVGYWATINISWSRNHSELTMPVSIEITRVEE